MKHIKDIQKEEKGKSLFPLGINPVDKLIGGYKPGEMIVFAGHAVSGRDEILRTIAEKLVMRQNVPVGSRHDL